MSLINVSCGHNAPDEVNVIIEIPMHGQPVKYEIDKDTGALCVDRFLSTSMSYPANYGYIPMTLSEDGDPVDVLVITPVPLIHGAVIKSRIIGLLNMTDEAGSDAKLLAVPVSKLSSLYKNIHTIDDLPEGLLLSIKHFFEHYKDLETGKWVSVDGWEGPKAAKDEIVSSMSRYKSQSIYED